MRRSIDSRWDYLVFESGENISEDIPLDLMYFLSVHVTISVIHIYMQMYVLYMIVYVCMCGKHIRVHM